MRSKRVPEGWEFWTTERGFEEAWQLASEYKRMREGVRADVFVRVRVVTAPGGHWILRREEQREAA